MIVNNKYIMSLEAQTELITNPILRTITIDKALEKEKDLFILEYETQMYYDLIEAKSTDIDRLNFLQKSIRNKRRLMKEREKNNYYN